MLKAGLVPARVLCSPATRTRQTWALMAPILGDLPVAFPADLYRAGSAEILAAVREAHGESPLLVIGHNPGLQEAAVALCSSGSRDHRDRLATKLPTAALAVVDLPARQWADVGSGTGVLVDFVRPKDLPGAEDRGL